MNRSHGFLFLVLWTVVVWVDRSGPSVHAVDPLAPPNQRQILEELEIQLRWMDNATRTATKLTHRADAVLWQNYEGIRINFGALTRTLTPLQLQYGANDIAELDAGWVIIGEAFANFQDDLNGGRAERLALQTLCQVLHDGTRVWAQQLDRVARRLRMGR